MRVFPDTHRYALVSLVSAVKSVVIGGIVDEVWLEFHKLHNMLCRALHK